MGAEGRPKEPYDFGTLDFARLWAGREKTTLVEREVVERELYGAAPGRVLEAGPGSGRITPILRRRFREYVGVDVTDGFLDALHARVPELQWLFQADVESLPFSDGAFSAVSMVRVYNFLLEPEAALREFHRVLAPGGVLVLSYHHVPSIGTLYEDVRNLLADPRPAGYVPITFGRKEILLPRRERVLAAVRAAGFEVMTERATGLEDFGPARWIPTAMLVGLSEATARSFVFPHRFLEARKAGPTPRSLPNLSQILRCPRCAAPWDSRGTEPKVPARCPNCGRLARRTAGGVESLLPEAAPPADRGPH